MKLKLSRSQLIVLYQMIAGNELFVTGFFHKKVPSHTIQSLRKLGLIEYAEGSIMKLQLTELGKTIDISTY